MSDEANVDSVDTDTAVDASAEVDAPVEGAEALGDAGKKALDTMKAERNAERARARDAEARAAELEAKLQGREAEFAAEVEKRKTQNEAILRAELKAAAKGRLADPTDAALFIQLSNFDVSENGDVDADALNAAIDDLIARKPHLGADKARRFDGDADTGPKGDGKPVQIRSREELSRMTPDEIVEAEAAGRLADLLGGKS
ncbi:membrane protein involved in colicin uptake [Agromyces sp. 3263]|uniref:hypothetical protein n=1 Tax=Agromyces sp. 3263 TaxID=2817750 RepID=UPI0028629C6B|nr:hypothetical protein [Agromyces sp. 3263]MDR6907475.1 membrane protein involved in colicin uptake [Agromyces sp. 3263]